MVKWSLDSLSKTVLPMTVFALYEVKSVPFIWVFEYVKVLPCSCLPDMFQPFMKSFKWGTTCTSILRDIKNTCSQTFGCPISLNKMGLFWILWLVVILMPFEIELHAVYYLKGLNYVTGKSDIKKCKILIFFDKYHLVNSTLLLSLNARCCLQGDTCQKI